LTNVKGLLGLNLSIYVWNQVQSGENKWRRLYRPIIFSDTDASASLHYLVKYQCFK